MTKGEAVYTVVNGDKATAQELVEARQIISEAFSNGYVLVNRDKLVKFLQAGLTKEMAEVTYNELIT